MSAAQERTPTLYDRHGEKLRYLVVGVMNTAIGYGLFVVLLWIAQPLQQLSDSPIAWVSSLGAHYYLAIQWVAWVLAVPISTTTMKYLVFRSTGHLGREVFRAYFIYLPAQGISTVVLWASVSLLGLSPQLGQLLTIGATTIFSYVGHKYFTFRAPLTPAMPDEAELVEPGESQHVPADSSSPR